MTNKVAFLYISLSVFLSLSCKKDGDKEIDPETIEGLSEPTSSYGANIINDYSALQLILIPNTPGYETPVAARSMAYLALAAYEAGFNGIKDKKSLSGTLDGFSKLPEIDNTLEYNWPLAINSSQYTLMKKLYGTTGDVLKSRMDTLKRQYETFYKNGVGSDIVERSIRFGEDVAFAVWDYSQTDNGHAAYDNNYPKNNNEFSGVGRWKPTGESKRPLLPHWGTVRTFGPGNSKLTVKPAKTFSFSNNTEFFSEVNDVYTTANNLNVAQTAIMNFWYMPKSSVTQAGNQLAFLLNLLSEESYKLDRTLLLNIKVAFAMHDAMVVSYKNKYENNIMRPSSYIHEAIDSNWQPNLPETPVPDFTSEQATLVSAVATILTSEFGEDYTFEIISQADKTQKRAFNTFSSYAKEATVAPIYAGIHYRMSTTNGALQGITVASNVLNLNFQKEAVEDNTIFAVALN
jgi:hypothetical protein